MKLSEAIMLGRSVIEYVDAQSFCGCAIGLGLAALGYKYKHFAAGQREANESVSAFKDAMKEWPWLNRGADRAPDWFTSSYGEQFYDVISEGFNLVSQERLTLESLADWIHSVEPEEDANTPPREELKEVEENQIV